MTRPTWDDYFLMIARVVAARADCTRRKVGAVVVKNNRIVATGYNGAPAGHPGCLDGNCSRGLHYSHEMREGVAYCACGEVWPCDESTKPGENYDNCISVHAEANALLYADRDKCEGATIYITDLPCWGCTKLIYGAGIVRWVAPSVDQ